MPTIYIKGKVGKFEVTISGNSEEMQSMISDLRELNDKLLSQIEGSKHSEAQQTASLVAPLLSNKHSAASAIHELMSFDWGREPRTLNEIKEALEANGLFYPSTSLSGVLFRLIKGGRIRRFKRGDRYVYVSASLGVSSNAATNEDNQLSPDIGSTAESLGLDLTRNK